MNTVFSDRPYAGNDISTILFFIVYFKRCGIDRFKVDVQSMAA